MEYLHSLCAANIKVYLLQAREFSVMIEGEKDDFSISGRCTAKAQEIESRMANGLVCLK